MHSSSESSFIAVITRPADLFACGFSLCVLSSLFCSEKGCKRATSVRLGQSLMEAVKKCAKLITHVTADQIARETTDYEPALITIRICIRRAHVYMSKNP